MQTKTWSLICRLCIASVLVFTVVLLTVPTFAKVTGVCSDCHTMHNSQDGTYDTTLAGASLTDGPYSALTKGDCVGCHTGTNTGTGTRSNNIPYVYTTSGVDYSDDGTTGNTLAGGNFYWVTLDDAKGHNVEGIVDADGTITTPPGFDTGRASADGTTPGSTWASNRLTCGGTYGCHGTHAADTNSWGAISGGHHTNSSGAITSPGTTAPGGYRFLVGIAGYEDSDHEYQPTTTAHNQYKGVDDPGQTSDTSTISYLCAQCHGEFHDGTGNIGSASPWLRHPTDFDMGNATGTEYESYNGGSGTANTYSIIAPVGSATVSSVLSSVNITTANGTAIVTCISCHRAHGTPNDDLLRWDYSGISAGGGSSNAGCFICHTTKDDS